MGRLRGYEGTTSPTGRLYGHYSSDAVRTVVQGRQAGREAIIRLTLDLHRISSPTYYSDGKPLLGDSTYFVDRDIKLADHDALNRTLADFLLQHRSAESR